MEVGKKEMAPLSHHLHRFRILPGFSHRFGMTPKANGYILFNFMHRRGKKHLQMDSNLS